MKNGFSNFNINLDWDFGYSGDMSDNIFDKETFKKMLIIFGAGCLLGVWFAIIFAAFLYGIQQQKTVDEGRLTYGKLFVIIIVPCILLGLIAGILLL